MSKFIPDPQIQSLKAMRAGDIAFAAQTPLLGVAPVATAQPIVNIPIAPPAPPPTLEALAGIPTEAPVLSVAFFETLSVDAAISVNPGTVDSLETLSGTPSETPTVGVAFGTSVV
jgi:hypothetical protein